VKAKLQNERLVKQKASKAAGRLSGEGNIFQAPLSHFWVSIICKCKSSVLNYQVLFALEVLFLS